MYRLLIIDDEQTVREGIKTLVNWDDFGFNSIYEGFDGKDGLNKVLNLSPDLVLVDIKMPGMSGIELIRQAKEKGYDGKFLILTGHSDFEFARSAISLGVRGYILKPIDEDELEEHIQDLVKELQAKRTMNEFLTHSEKNGKNELLRKLLLNQKKEEDIPMLLKQYGINFSHNTYTVAIVTNKRTREFYNEITLEQKEIDKDIVLNMERVYIDDRLVIITKGYKSSELMDLLTQWLDRRQKTKGDTYFITVGHHVAHYLDVCFSYECAKMLSSYQFIMEDKRIIDIHTIERLNSKEDLKEFEEQLLNYIEVGDKDGIVTLIKIKKEYYQSKVISESEVKVNITYGINKIYRQLEKKYENNKEEFYPLDDILQMVKESENLNVLMEQLQRFCINTSDILQTSTTDNVVMRIVSYMEKNYDKDLKLETLSKVFSYNSAYLGKIFKKYVGENFNNTLDKIRIENAKRLLLESDLKVYQVSEKVGYSNIDYFYSKFKKHVGISPKEYKSSLM